MKTKWVAIVLAAASLLSFSGCGNEEVNSDSSSQIESSEDEKEDLSEDVIDKKAHADCASFLVSDDWSYREVEENNSTQKLFYWNKTDDNYFYVKEQEFLDSYTGDLNDTKEYLHWLYNAHVDQDDAVIVEECEDTTISGQDAVKFKYTETKEREGRDKTALMYITVYDNKAYYFVFVDRGDSDYKISDYGEEVVKSIVLSGGEISRAEQNTEREEVTYELNKTDSVAGISFLVSDEWEVKYGENAAYYYCYDNNGNSAGMIGVSYVGSYPGSSKNDQLEVISEIVNGDNTGLESSGARNIKTDTAFLTSKQWAARIDYTIYNEETGDYSDVTGYTFFVGDSAYSFIYYDKSGINDIFHCSVDMIESITELDSDTKQQESEQPNQSTWETLSYSGSGDQVLTDVPLPSETMIMHATYNGDGNFIVHYHDCNDNEEYIVNEIGSYEGYQAFENTHSDDSSAGMLEVTGSGNWTIEFIPLETFLQQASSMDFSGTGDGVTWWFNGDGQNHVVNLSHDGQHNFIAKLYSMDGDREEYIVNEIGSYNGQTVVHTEAGQRYFISVTADGNWSISFQ